MAVKAVNDTAGPDGLVPTLLVFGAYPRMSELDPPEPSIAQRAAAIRKAMEEVLKVRAERQINNALSQRNGPSVDAIHNLPLNSDVLVWREGNTGQSGKWTGPFKLVSIDRETCKVQLPSGVTDFRTTVVKPFLESEPELDEEEDRPTEAEEPNADEPAKPRRNADRERQLPARFRQNTADASVLCQGTADISVFFLHDDETFENTPPLFTESRRKELIVFTDSSFANNHDLSSQIGFIITLVDKDNKTNIIHWSSIKCKRVTRSVLASELYGMAHGFDVGATIKATIEKILRIKRLPLVLCTDSKSLYDCLVKLGTTQEKRLMADLMCLRQSYVRREIAETKWIDGNSNPADAMTKSKPCQALKDLIDTNTVKLEVTEWVERVGVDGKEF